MAEIEKEAVGFPVMCDHVAREFTYGGSTLFFAFNFIYIIQLYREDSQSCKYVRRLVDSSTQYRASSVKA